MRSTGGGNPRQLTGATLSMDQGNTIVVEAEFFDPVNTIPSDMQYGEDRLNEIDIVLDRNSSKIIMSGEKFICGFVDVNTS